MAIPEFIKRLRLKVGQELVWLPGVTGVVLNEERQILLVQRADTQRWTLVSGCLEPGEQPAEGMVREIFEETGVTAVVDRVVSVQATQQARYPNGDAVQFLDVAFQCRAVNGSARVNDDESVDVRWFSLEDLPELTTRATDTIARVVDGSVETWFAAPINQTFKGPLDLE